MLSKTVEVRNSTGLHARPAACLAKAAKKYSCKVTLHYEGNDINATSMMNIMRA
ncbi:TPA: HPr family phosphocarrier protein, partial [Escherichia coli]